MMLPTNYFEAVIADETSHRLGLQLRIDELWICIALRISMSPHLAMTVRETQVHEARV